ncbi:Ycf12 (chloroplast) [Guillardia theta]|uniref:Photosystem II reaction center protein Psb30 n=2 Tax=Guillardia theta TaxID=55529 RepID=PSB30_GUITH|nr:Ycf12 [Guillardia theta]O78460.1 RecName: Full=Photosystem II reaction center protein Psb30; AltName: Full=Photosystem II reaction center protein Ycf12 [Guillardia theta]AAC35651.1 hypothetical chloroplast RF12 [Guillardia theta]
MPNLQTVAQLLALFVIITSGPAIIILIALRRGNL